MHFCTADFETLTVEPTRVWLWGLYDGNIFYNGTTIGGFIDKCKKYTGNKIYFHNLAWDGTFILVWLFNNGYKYSESKKLEKKHFSTLITDTGIFYTLKVKTECNKILTFYDSMKLIPLKVKEIPSAFGLKTQKGEIDFTKDRPEGYEPTIREKNYCERDCKIVYLALQQLFDKGLKKMTQAGCAIEKINEFLGGRLKDIFPVLDKSIDAFCRKSYKGGISYLNDQYFNKILDNINIYDVNSLYPAMMYKNLYPFGDAFPFTGKYEYNPLYPLYIIKIKAGFDIKEGKFPTIQLKGSMFFSETEYIKSTHGEIVELYLTSVDFELFEKHYDIYDIEYCGGYMFRARDDFFTKYVDFFMKEKEEARRNGEEGRAFVAKIFLNSGYGRYGINPESARKIPYIEENTIKYKTTELEERESLFVPVAAFVTSYARKYLAESIQKIIDYSTQNYNTDMFIYCDTDSIHTLLPHDDVVKILQVDKVKLGYWKHEGKAVKGKFLRQKTYIEYMEKFRGNGFVCYDKKVTCAAMPSECHQYVNIFNFNIGESFKGKKQKKNVRGGIILKDIDFTLK